MKRYRLIIIVLIALLGMASMVDSLELFLRQAAAAGCPRDQAERFMQAIYMPQPKQIDFHAAARLCDREDGPEYIGYGGTRGQAKSHAVLAQVGLDDCQRVAGLKWLYLRKLQKSAGEQLDDLVRKLFTAIPYEFPHRTVKFANGSRIVIGGFRSERDIDNYIGIEYDGIVVEDATTISKTKIDQIFGSLRTSKMHWRPRAYLSFNPGGVGHAWARAMFYDPWVMGRETVTRFIHTTMGDNKFINPGYERYLNSLTGWLRRAWRDGDFSIAAGQFFINFDPTVHVIPPAFIDRDATWWLAMDYGSTHWNMTYLLAQAGERIYVVDEHAARRQLAKENAAGIQAMLERNGSPWLHSQVAGHDIFAQRGTELTIAQDYERYGFQWTPAKTDRINGAGRIAELLGKPRPQEPGEATIEPRLFIFDRCSRLIECLPQMQVDPARSEDVLKVDCDPDTGEGGDDPYDGMRYGIMEVNETGSGWGPNPMAGYRG